MKMSLQHWVDNHWLHSHNASVNEIAKLLAVVDRDLADGEKKISQDRKFSAAYNAPLTLCTVLLRAAGYRADSTRQHYLTIQAMPLILGKQRVKDAKFLDSCRAKRNTIQYESVGVVTEIETKELVAFVKTFKKDVKQWLNKHYPELVSL